MKTATLFLLLATVPGWAAPDQAPPHLRLGDNVRPTRYALDLTLEPERDDFSGTIDIDIELHAPASVIWLNSTDLTIQQATLSTGRGIVEGRPLPGGKDFAGIAFSSPVPEGAAKLHITYRGRLNPKSSSGLFKVKEGDDWYIFSQFEATDARRAFPCFDEPSFKVPWELTLHVKKEHVALGNMPVVAETAEPGGRKKVRFAISPPLPSYLIAVAVGPLEIVDAGKAGKQQTPVRIVTTRGKASQAKYAVEVTATILGRLEAYFGIPYPYPKLDNVAVPLMGGAMENAGLVTYNQTMILSDPALDSIGRQRNYASVCAHELAHQWFGDLVTMAWWDDTWLNEAFATWTASKILAEWKPEWRSRLSDVDSRQGAMDEDSLVSARKIRQPIESNNDISNAFDGITYEKGASVIRMFETWIGEQPFQSGVRRYLRQYASRNATSGDFLDSLSSTAKQGVTKAFSSFLDQAGVPLVSVELACGGGSPIVRLTQKRALPVGSAGPGGQTWEIPVCFRYSAGGEIHRECTLMTGAAMEWKLQSKACPDWVSANAEGEGYYRVLYNGDLLHRLLAESGKQLTETERATLLGDVSALMEMGTVKASEALALVPVFARDKQPQIIASAAEIAGGIRSHLVPKELEANYVRFVQQVFGERARQLGWQSKPGEDDETRLLRTRIVPFVADNGGDTQLAAEAMRLAERWLTDRKSLDPNIVRAVLSTAAKKGDRKLFDRFLAAAKATRDRRQRGYLLSALGSFRDPVLAQAGMALLLSGQFDLREAGSLLYGPMRYPETRALPFQFVKANFDELLKRSPTEGTFNAGAAFPHTGSSFCDERSRADVETFFAKRIENLVGGPRNLAQTLESINLCEALVEAQQPSVTEFLRRY